MVYYITSFSHSWPSVCLCQTANALLSMFVRPALKFCSFPALCFILGLYWSYFTGVTGFKASPFVSAILRHDRQNLNVQHSCSTSPRTWRQWAVNSPVLVCALASGAVVSPCCWGQAVCWTHCSLLPASGVEPVETNLWPSQPTPHSQDPMWIFSLKHD